MKKHIPAICVVVFLVVLAAGVPVLRVVFAHASSVTGTYGVPDTMLNATPPVTTTVTPPATITPPAIATVTPPTTGTGASMSYADACPEAPAGYARCLAMISTTTVQPTFAALNISPNAASGIAAPAAALAPGSNPPYSPNALHNTYNLPTTAATAQTVAIVDAFDDPNAETDLATYRSMFNLPACTTANGCFQKVNQMGGTTPPTANASWGAEISLDLDMVSAICQNCHILLVEANSASFTDLGTAAAEAATLGANEISNSYGGPESAAGQTACSFYTHAGVAVTASAGDSGPAVNFPSACPDVTSVGGTTLAPSGTETAWNTSATVGSGGGCSTLVTIPAWQKQAITNCAMRATTDVSAVANPQTGVFVFDTFNQPGAVAFGGTSVSSPIIAATFALAGGTAGKASSAMVPWTQSAQGCLKTVGGVPYALQSGLGAPNGIACF